MRQYRVFINGKNFLVKFAAETKRVGFLHHPVVRHMAKRKPRKLRSKCCGIGRRCERRVEQSRGSSDDVR